MINLIIWKIKNWIFFTDNMEMEENSAIKCYLEMSNDEMADDESAGEIDESSDGSEELLSTYEIMVMRSCIF